MLPRPRILAIDDDVDHVTAIADALNERGIACLKLPFSGGITPATKLIHIRVLFMDLHLVQPGIGDPKIHYSTIGGLLAEHIADGNGPFVLIVWTAHPDQVEGLAQFLGERLQDRPAAIPVLVESLSKADHLVGGKIVDVPAFMRAIDRCLSRLPAVDALVDWEEHVTSAASQTIAAVLELALRRKGADLGGELSRLLNALATEAAGSAHVGKHRFGAVNEALLPILYDRVSQLKHVRERGCWKKAIPQAGSTPDVDLAEAARLNTFLHVDIETSRSRSDDRGMVLTRDDASWDEASFKSWFAISKAEFLSRQVRLPTAASFRWVLVQVEASCDNAQGMAGPPPYLLGVECPDKAAAEINPGTSLWISPVIEIDLEPRRVVASYRFAPALTETALKDFKMLYRFREALANDVVTRWHTYGARPGIVRFQVTEKRQSPGKNSGPFSHIKF
jgi:hypothetical protein